MTFDDVSIRRARFHLAMKSFPSFNSNLYRFLSFAIKIDIYLADDSNKCDIVTADTVEQLINEIANIKTQMNSTELQLYEANEKIAELIENVSDNKKRIHILCAYNQ